MSKKDLLKAFGLIVAFVLIMIVSSVMMARTEELPEFEKGTYCIAAETNIFIFSPAGMVPSTIPTDILVKKIVKQPSMELDIFVDTKSNGVGEKWRNSVMVYYDAERIYLLVLKKDVVAGNICKIRM